MYGITEDEPDNANKLLHLSFRVLLGALTLTALITAVAWAISSSISPYYDTDEVRDLPFTDLHAKAEEMGINTRGATYDDIVWEIAQVSARKDRETKEEMAAIIQRLALLPALVASFAFLTTLIAFFRSTDDDPIRKTIRVLLRALLIVFIICTLFVNFVGVHRVVGTSHENVGMLWNVFAYVTAIFLLCLDLGYLMRKTTLMYVSSILFALSFGILTILVGDLIGAAAS